jgi:predicted acylesterase/phospholipase RssA
VATEPRTAFVLAGGGFKGAFELGALQHLVDTLGIVPDVVTATSAGAVLGTVLSQGRDESQCRTYLGEAEGDLLAMTEVDVVFDEEPWLRELEGTPAADSILRLVTTHGRPEFDDDGDDLAAAADDGGADSRRRHPLSDLVETARRLPAARRAHPKGEPRAVLNLDPFERAVRDGGSEGISTLDPQLVARPGLDLRLAVTAVKARQTHYVTGQGVLVGPDARTPVAGASGFDLIDGMIASASVPGVFPARHLGTETYVDGGCLQNIPLAAAVTLGAERIFTTVAVRVRESRRSPSLWAAEELGYLSTQAENLAVPLRGATNTLIEPTVEVVGSFEVHRGLMKIDIDYGRLRAEEVMADLDDGARPIATTASDTVTRLRYRAWHLEDAACRAGRLEGARLERLRDLKRAVRSAVDARAALGFPAPAGSDRWWSGWEVHSGDLPPGAPDSFD